jgi:hypothetical protein
MYQNSNNCCGLNPFETLYELDFYYLINPRKKKYISCQTDRYRRMKSYCFSFQSVTYSQKRKNSLEQVRWKYEGKQRSPTELLTECGSAERNRMK